MALCHERKAAGNPAESAGSSQSIRRGAFLMQALRPALRVRAIGITRFFFILVVALACCGGALYAQNSQISGRILDPSQASVESATVSLTRADNGDHREATSSAEGYYSFPLLVPGTYDLTVQKTGFQSQIRKGITVGTGQISSVDVALTLGDVSQSVDVDASAPH
jgi:hypothetical protein